MLRLPSHKSRAIAPRPTVLVGLGVALLAISAPVFADVSGQVAVAGGGLWARESSSEGGVVGQGVFRLTGSERFTWSLASENIVGWGSMGAFVDSTHGLGASIDLEPGRINAHAGVWIGSREERLVVSGFAELSGHVLRRGNMIWAAVALGRGEYDHARGEIRVLTRDPIFDFFMPYYGLRVVGDSASFAATLTFGFGVGG